MKHKIIFVLKSDKLAAVILQSTSAKSKDTLSVIFPNGNHRKELHLYSPK